MFERRQHVESANAPARSVSDVPVDRYDDGRPVKGVDELGRDDPDDAAMPAFARHDEDAARADGRIGLDDLPGAREDRRLFFLPPHVLAVELPRQILRFRRHRLVGRQQQPRGDVRARHPARGVHARRDLKRHMAAVDRLAGQAGHFDQRAQTDLVRSLRQQVEAELRDDAILSDERDDIGQRADGRDLDERRQQPLAIAFATERLHELQRDADAREILVGIVAIVAPRVDHRDRDRQLGIGLVVIRDDQDRCRSSRARFAASMPRMPQSTEMTSVTPSACSRSNVSG